ncbi:MAG: hypothetical protein K5864_04015 [Bacteroidales bacterium]|nr:hypothetical protein [Bacteroidales bacterium]
MKTRRIIPFLALLLTVTIFVSCTPHNHNYVSRFESFVEEVEQNATTYDYDDWERVDQEYEMFNSRLERQRLTSEQRKEVGRLHARYLKARTVGEVNTASKKLSEGIDYAEGFLNELSEFIDE